MAVHVGSSHARHRSYTGVSRQDASRFLESPTVTLSRDFYLRPTLQVASDLIGKLLVHQTPSGRASGLIVEAEAYIGESDPACHAAPGRTRRNAPLYGPPGIAYVYLNYGMHYLVNAVTEGVDAPAAVLIRALEPREGIDLMRRRRSRGTGKPAKAWQEHGLCRGPGNLTKSLGISLEQNGVNLTGSRLFIEDVGETLPIAWGPRIGINVGVESPWRCFVPGHPCVSGGPRYAVGAPDPSVTRGSRDAPYA
jgi:DNA-3-methyladenine glycosylase